MKRSVTQSPEAWTCGRNTAPAFQQNALNMTFRAGAFWLQLVSPRPRLTQRAATAARRQAAPVSGPEESGKTKNVST